MEEKNTVAVGIVTRSKRVACSGAQAAAMIPTPAPTALTKLPASNTTDATRRSTACGVGWAKDNLSAIQERKGIVFMDTR